MLRRRGLLFYADKLYAAFIGIKSYCTNYSENKTFKNDHPDFVPPPILLAYDAYGEINWSHYYEYGLQLAVIIARIIEELIGNAGDVNILEWGCGPARIIRHLPDILPGENYSISGTDYNVDSIDWCSKNIHGINFYRNELNPPLNADDETYDFVYCYSVFTHLSEELHEQWLFELLRVTKIKGFILLTTTEIYFGTD